MPHGESGNNVIWDFSSANIIDGNYKIYESIRELQENSELFTNFYSQLENSTTDIHVRWGETIRDPYSKAFASGQYSVDYKTITYRDDMPACYWVIVEENYHAYQDLFGIDYPLWNREFEAKVLTSLVLGQYSKIYVSHPNMEDFSLKLCMDPYYYINNIENLVFDYLKYGFQFSKSYIGNHNYSKPVYQIPRTIMDLIRH